MRSFTSLLLATVCLAPSVARGQTTWTGATSTDWFTGGNWSAGTPAGGVQAIVNTANGRDPLVAGGVTGRAGRVVIGNNPGQSGGLNVTGALTVDENTALGSFIVGNFGTGTVVVSGGGDLSTGLTGIANFGGSTGTVTVTGAGSTWNITNAIDIGSSGTGTLNVLAGGVVTDGVLTNIANDVGAVGTLNISGTGSTYNAGTFTNIGAASGPGSGAVNVSDSGLFNGGIVTVGAFKQGSLLVESGADASGSTITIGNFANGQATVTGAGSTLTSTASIVVGASSTGTFTVSAGGVANSDRGRLGTASTGNGTATVTGTGSQWNITDDLLVGENGTGALNIQAGGVVNANEGVMAVNTGTTGTITVTGAGSQLNITTSLRTGLATNVFGTSGTLNVLNGGAVNVGSGVIGDYLIANNSTAILVDGTGSLLTITQGNPGTPSFIRLGFNGTNSLNVTAGGAVSFDRADFATVASSSVAVVADGAGTTWSSNGFTLGGAGTASFVISNGASVNTNATDATVTRSGAGTASLTVSSGGSLTSTGRVNIVAGTLLIDSGGGLSASDLTLGGSSASGTTATVTGAGSTLTTTGSLSVSNGGNATLDVNGGASINTTNVGIGNGAGGTGTVTVSGAGTTWTANSIGTTIFSIGGSGSLTLQTGATMSVAGTDSNSMMVSGALVVRDAGTSLQTNLAVSGAGSAQILNGAVVQGVGGSVGVANAGSSTITVDGANSRWTMTGILDVGISSTGTLNIQNNGTVSSAEAYVGCCSTGTGTVNVIGSGALWQVTGTARIGDFGNGTLSVTGGGDVTTGATLIGARSGSVGNATITGAGSTWTNAGTIAIGANGAGTLTVTDGGTVTSTGAVTINSSSALNIGTGGLAGTFAAPSIANDGTVTFNHTGTVSFGVPMSGAGALVKNSAGTTILTADNTYTGTTTINAGVLQIGAGGPTGAIVGDVINGGTLTFNRTNSLTYGGVISGGGVVTQIGGGTTIFTANSTYTGGTTISAGTLQLGNGGTAGAVIGNVLNNGTLAFNRSNALTFAGAISGTGNVVHDGSGTTSLTGTSTYIGTTTINAGTLSVDGSIATSAVTVNAGGTLAGNGTVGTTNVIGTVAPGNSIGTLNVVGSFTQTAASTYLVEVMPGGGPGTSDLINVTGAPGTAVIQPGATLSVFAAPGGYTVATRYTILTASGGVTGNYTNLIDNAPFLDFALASDPNNIYLDITRAAAMFSSVAVTPNQKAAAAAAEALGPGNPIFNAIVPLDTNNALRAFDLLSGEIYASVKTALLEDSRFVRDAVIGRLRQSSDGPASIFSPGFATLNFLGDDRAGMSLFDPDGMAYSPRERRTVRDAAAQIPFAMAAQPVEKRTIAGWGHTFGNWGRIGGDGNAANVSRNAAGIVTGLDATWHNMGGATWRTGVAGAFQTSSLRLANRNSSGSVETKTLAAYAGVQNGPLGLRSGAAFAWHGIDTTRSVVFPGFADATRASYDARTAQVYSEAGYAVTLKALALEPFAALAHVNLQTDAFVETGGTAALSGAADRIASTFSTLGLRAAMPVPAYAGLTARVSTGWRHAFGAVVPTAWVGFANATPFNVGGVPLARDAAAIEAGLDGRVAGTATLAIAYTGQLTTRGSDHGITARFVQPF